MLNDHCHRVSTHLQSINIIIIINISIDISISVSTEKWWGGGTRSRLQNTGRVVRPVFEIHVLTVSAYYVELLVSCVGSRGLGLAPTRRKRNPHSTAAHLRRPPRSTRNDYTATTTDHCDTRPPLETNDARLSPREPTQLTNNWTYYANTGLTHTPCI